MYKIIDIHTHIYPERISDKATRALSDFYRFIVNSKGTIEDLEDQCSINGVTGFLLLSVATNAHQVRSVNDYAAECVSRSRSRGYEAYGFASMHQEFEQMEREVERILSLGLKGVKLHRQKAVSSIRGLFIFRSPGIFSQRRLQAGIPFLGTEKNSKSINGFPGAARFRSSSRRI